MFAGRVSNTPSFFDIELIKAIDEKKTVVWIPILILLRYMEDLAYESLE